MPPNTPTPGRNSIVQTEQVVVGGSAGIAYDAQNDLLLFGALNPAGVPLRTIAAGITVVAANFAALPAPQSNPGRVAFSVAENSLWVSNGSAWVSISSSDALFSVVDPNYWTTPGAPLAATINTVHPNQNSVRCYPFDVVKRTRFDRASFNVVSGAAGGVLIRFGVYDSDPLTNLPRSLVADFGDVDCSSNGIKTVTIDITLGPNARYWYAFNNNSAGSTPLVSSVSQANSQALGLVQASFVYSNQTLFAFNYAPFPASLAGLTSPGGPGNYPLAAFRLVSQQ